MRKGAGNSFLRTKLCPCHMGDPSLLVLQANFVSSTESRFRFPCARRCSSKHRMKSLVLMERILQYPMKGSKVKDVFKAVLKNCNAMKGSGSNAIGGTCIESG